MDGDNDKINERVKTDEIGSSSSRGEKGEALVEFTPKMVEELIDEALKVMKAEKPEGPPPEFTPDMVASLLAEAVELSKASKNAEDIIIGKLISGIQFYETKSLEMEQLKNDLATMDMGAEIVKQGRLAIRDQVERAVETNARMMEEMQAVMRAEM